MIVSNRVSDDCAVLEEEVAWLKSRGIRRLDYGNTGRARREAGPLAMASRIGRLDVTGFPGHSRAFPGFCVRQMPGKARVGRPKCPDRPGFSGLSRHFGPSARRTTARAPRPHVLTVEGCGMSIFVNICKHPSTRA